MPQVSFFFLLFFLLASQISSGKIFSFTEMEIWASNAEDMCLVSLNRGTCFYMSKFAPVWSRNCTRANSVVRSAVYAKVSVVPAAGCSGVSKASFDFRGCCAGTTTLPSCHSSLPFCRQPVSGPHRNKCYWHLLAFVPAGRHWRPPGACRCKDSAFSLHSAASPVPESEGFLENGQL